MAAAALWRGSLELHFPADENSVTVTDKNGKGITVSGGNGKYTFTMPSSKITVTPLFSKLEENQAGNLSVRRCDRKRLLL